MKLLSLTAALLLAAPALSQTPYLHAPAGDQYATFNPSGTTIIPDGRLLRPAGHHVPLARWPHGLALSPDGQTAFVASAGVGQMVTAWQSDAPQVTEFLPDAEPKRRANAGGAAWSPDGKTLYWSSGESGKVYIFDTATREKQAEIDLNVPAGGQPWTDSFAMDVQISGDGQFVYCADVTNFRVIVIDAAQKKVVGAVKVGRYPYALAVLGQTVYVANIGMFEYSPIPAPKPGSAFDKRGLTFPPFAYPSKEAENGTDVEDRHVAGLGKVNTPDSFSVWGINVSDPASPKVTAKIKTGLLVGAVTDSGKAVGGSAPNFLAVSGKRVYVSDGNNDMVEALDTATQKMVWRTRIVPSPLVAKVRGVGPSGMVVSHDGSRLYVCESGIAALGVLDTATGKVLGHLPTTWYPYRVTLAPDDKTLGIIGFRGFGNGPTGGANRPDSPYLGMKGAWTSVAVPSETELAADTQTVLENNGIIDKSADRSAMASPLIPNRPGKGSPEIKYVVFITKENHTFDTIFDHVPGANDDPTLLRWGLHQASIANIGQPTLTDAAVMTNHNALARQFTVSDNFYMQPEASGVGHRWLIGVQPDNFCQMTYTLGWDFKANSPAPGRRASFGSNGSIAPEDYPEAGSMWEHLANYGVPFRNYGEGFEFAGVGEDEDEHKTGAREVVNIPMPKVVYDNTCRDFPIFNMNIPDQYRAFWFQQDIEKLYLNKKKPLPAFVNICICNDHGTDPNRAKGYPYRASWMADNDLSLGRIVEFLSHTPYWKNMAIFVTQDDAGGEPDHIDGQRSVLLAISPWIKHGYVSHRHTTILSMHRTLYEILGLPALNMFDALASDFSDCFTTTPDFTPYTHTPVDPRIFDPNKAKDPKDPQYAKARLLPSIAMDDPAEVAKNAQAGDKN